MHPHSGLLPQRGKRCPEQRRWREPTTPDSTKGRVLGRRGPGRRARQNKQMGQEQQRQHNAGHAEPQTPNPSHFSSATTTDAARQCSRAETCDTFRVEDTHNSARCDCQFSTTQSNQPYSANVKQKSKQSPRHLVTLGIKSVGRHANRQRQTPPTQQNLPTDTKIIARRINLNAKRHDARQKTMMEILFHPSGRCKEYISNYRKLATKTVYLHHDYQHER